MMPTFNVIEIYAKMTVRIKGKLKFGKDVMIRFAGNILSLNTILIEMSLPRIRLL